MSTPLLVTTPASAGPRQYLLCIDKEGSVARALLPYLRTLYRILLISGQNTAKNDDAYLPYGNTLPSLPRGEFSQLIAVFQTKQEVDKALPRVLRTAATSGTNVLIVAQAGLLSAKGRQKILSNPRATILLFGDLFGGQTPTSPVAALLMQIKKEGQITLSNMGLTPLYPISVLGLSDVVLQVLFDRHEKREFYAAGRERTALSLIRFLQKVDPLLRVDFQTTKERTRTLSVPSEAYHLMPPGDREEGELRAAIERLPEHSLTFIPAPSPRSGGSALGGKIMFGALFLLFLPLILIGLFFLIGFASLGVAGLAFNQDNLGMTQKVSSASVVSFSLAEPSEQLVLNFLDVAGVTFPQSSLFTTLSSGKTSAVLLSSLSRSVADIESGLQGKRSVSPDDLQVSLKKTVYALQTLEAQNILPTSFRQQLKHERESISLLTSMLEIAPSLLGYEGKKQYAILFQDNMELRPGGGYIHAIGHVTLERGEMKDISVQPVNDFDSRLKGHIDPPFPIRRYGGAAHWYLRDSNLSLSSTVNATSAAQFLQLETGAPVDGIISVDLSFLRQLLGVIGSVQVAPETVVSKESLFQEIAQSGEKGKGDGMLISVEEQLLKQVGQRQFPFRAFLAVLTKGIEEKHLVAMAFDSATQPVIARSGFVSTPETIQTADVIGISESNLGSNKANYYLKRSIAQRVVLRSDRTASSSVKLVYTNTSRDETFGGDYKSYVRLLLPRSTRLTGIEINGVKQAIFPAVTDKAVYGKSTFTEPKGIEVAEEPAFGKTLFGFLLTVKRGEERTVVIRYSPGPVLNTEHLSYDLTYFKQPGIEQDDYSIEVVYPESLRPTELPQQAEKRKASIYLNKEVVEDEVLHFTFAER